MQLILLKDNANREQNKICKDKNCKFKFIYFFCRDAATSKSEEFSRQIHIRQIPPIRTLYSDRYAKIRILEHFFLFFHSQTNNQESQATLLFGQSNAFQGAKHCFSPRKALLGRKSIYLATQKQSVLKVVFPLLHHLDTRVICTCTVIE